MTYELNDVPIIKSSYLYNTYISGYCIAKYENTEETTYFFKSHGKKYMIITNKHLKNEKIMDFDVKIKEVKVFEIPEGSSKVEYKYFAFEDKLSCMLKKTRINEMEDIFKIRFLGKKNADEKSLCIASEHLFIALDANVYDVYEKIDSKGIELQSAYELAKQMLTMDELKEYIASK
jgi:hypothetical protein